MRRLLGPIVAAWLLAVLVPAFLPLAPAGLVAPVVLADERDPRCAAWEADGAPPGVDLAVLCPAGDPAVGSVVDPGAEPLVPYIAALLVTATVLIVAGFVVMRVTGGRPAGVSTDGGAWWACAACGARNQGRRGACFACQASRAETAAPHPG